VGRIAFRYFVENSGPSGSNGDSIGIDDVVFTGAATPPSGACCVPSGCTVLTQAQCVVQDGTYRGDGVTCAASGCPQGVCCYPDGTCHILALAGCTAAGGTYRGDGTACASTECPQPYVEGPSDAGDLPATAAAATGSGVLPGIVGTLGPDDADLYRINICDPAHFLATTVGFSSLDTELFLFKADGTGVATNDEDPATGDHQSTLTSLFVAPLGAGDYFLAITEYNKDPQSSGGLIWNDQPFNVEHTPDGPGATGALSSWTSDSTTSGGTYVIRLVGACHTGSSSCYVNCDGSIVPPFLNIADFVCFQQRFAGGDAYANCDGSTQPPVLNIADFVCFQQRFAAGCSAP
jgi:hypothetical protein